MNHNRRVTPAMQAMINAMVGAISPVPVRRYDGPTPTKMDIINTPAEVLTAFDVYFNDKKQTLCTEADCDKGFIVRYVSQHDKRTERLEGKVEFKRK